MHDPFSRRSFLKFGGGLTALGFAGAVPVQAAEKRALRPKRLIKGHTIGLIAPGSNAVEDEDVRYAMDVVRSLGFKVKPGKHLFTRTQYLAGSDAQRADDLNAMFADPNVDAVFAMRGGYGSPRILPLLDYPTIAANPKVFMGYSDITALLAAIHKKTGLITFHGPIAKQEFSDYTLAEYKKVLMDAQGPVVIGQAPPFEVQEGRVERENRLTKIHPGRAEGPLLVGNLSLMVKLLGTPFEPDFNGRILVLEEVNEEPYRIDGMLTHLWLAGKLQQVAGIAFGKFTDCDSEDGNSFSLEEILVDRCKPLGVPCMRGLMVGHVKDMTVVPYGLQATLDVDRGTLSLNGAAVV